MSPTAEARRERRWTKWIAIYIAVLVTVLAVGVWESVGVNDQQNNKLASQARTLSLSNREAAVAGCERNNGLRRHMNVIGGALASLLRKSVESSPKPLTPDQEAFVQGLYRQLRPLGPVHCKKEYRHPDDPRASSSP